MILKNVINQKQTLKYFHPFLTSNLSHTIVHPQSLIDSDIILLYSRSIIPGHL